jgi:2-octaprenylphenol hydroxylase
MSITDQNSTAANGYLTEYDHAQQFDVIVAGAGLVGAAFASLLAQTEEGRNLRIAIIEAQPFSGYLPDNQFDPRVVALTEVSRKMLADIGIWQSIVEHRACPYTHMSVWDSEGTGFIEFDCREIHTPNIGHIVENSTIVGQLQEKIRTLPNIEMICPAKVSGVTKLLDTEQSSVLVTLDTGDQLIGQLLAAADGAISNVRQLCNFELNEQPYGHKAIVATIRCEKPHQFTARQWFSPTGPLAFLPLSNGDANNKKQNHISIVWSQQDNRADELMALDNGVFCQALSQASDAVLGAVTETSQRVCFPLSQRHAANYVQSSIALLGDAAHTIHPLAGQGVNLGFKDVMTLVEELQRACQRKLPLGNIDVLERYQRRRRPDNMATMLAMKGFKELFASDNLMVRLLRNEGMSLLNRAEPIKKKLIRQAMGL